MAETKESRVAFVVIKLKVNARPHFLMRKNKSWGDVSFIGGHINERDGGLLKRAAHRELLEEVPPLRTVRRFDLKSLTPQLHHGPVYSQSAKTTVVYDLQFFLVAFRETPEKAMAALGQRSLNVLVAEDELLKPSRYRVASLVELLDSQYAGGLRAIPYSWPGDLESADSSVTQSVLSFG